MFLKKSVSFYQKLVLSVGLVFCLFALPVFGAGGKASDGASTAASGPLGKYTPEINLTSARSMDAGIVYEPAKWKDYEDNQWFRNYKSELGINLSYQWISPDGDSDSLKWTTAIASGDVPDFARVNNRIYKLLLEADLIADMTKLWDEYASPGLKDMVTPADLSQMTFDGKLMGFPLPSMGIGEIAILFIRQDWLDKLGLPVPQTYEDVVAAARAFNTAKPAGPNTIPIALYNGSGWAGAGLWSGIFNAYGAYEGMWLEKNGQLVYGTVQREMRDALLSMQALLKEGLINRDFMAANDSTIGEYIANGQVGIFWGYNWVTSTSLHALDLNEPSNKWAYLYPPSVKGQNNLAQANLSVPPRIFVSNKSKYPEAAIKMANLAQKYELERSDYVMEGDVRPNKFNPWDQVIAYAEPTVTQAYAILDAERTGRMNPEYIRKYGGTDTIYESYKKAKETGDPDLKWYLNTWGEGSSLMVGYNAVQQKKLLTTAYLGLPTDTQSLLGSTIGTELQVAMTEVITGADISVFDRAVQKWLNDGGQKITDEVNQWYKANKK
ncbi:lipoprotein LipO [Spirochaetia bacterium]|nr:lipoprotein LipO [Spirochaetia bacterium]